MGFKNNSYCTLWKDSNGTVVTINGKIAKAKISISRKNKETKKYESDFSGYVTFIGKAFDKVKDEQFKDRDRLHLLEVETTIKKINDKLYTNFIVWDCERVDSNGNVSNPSSNITLEEVNEDDLPF